MRVSLRPPFLVPAAVLGVIVWVAPLQAQSGTIQGRIVSADTGIPIANASVEAFGAESHRAGTDQEGSFRLTVPAGTYAVVVTVIGYESHRVDAVRIAEGETVSLDLELRSRALVLDPIVATAGRGVEQKATEAPASVSVVTEEEIRNRPAASPMEHLRNVPGVDIATHGIQSGNVVARGFNNIFSGALHMLTDHRIAGVPSLRVNLMQLIPSTDEDVERIEVVLGPGSALYGPNTASGVLHVLTKSPLRSQGTALSVAGGERDLLHGTFRTAHLLGDGLGVKVSGQYLRGTEWELEDPVEQRNRQERIEAGADPETLLVGRRDFDLERWSGEIRGDWRIDDRTTAIFQVGRSVLLNSVELTGVGAGQARDWASSYYQVRMNRDRLFAQAYLNTSDAGDTFTLRDGDPIVDESRLFVGQLQHGRAVGDRQDFTYGLDYVRTMPETRGTIHGRHEDEDQYDEVGVYLQSSTGLADRLELVAAGRVDWHSELPDPVFSPRAGLVFTPAEGQSVRATYNRAFSTPTSVNLFLDLNAGPFPQEELAALGYGLRAQGSAGRGFTFRREDGSLTGMRSPFNPQGRHAVIPADVRIMWTTAVGILRFQEQIDEEAAAFLLQQLPGPEDVALAYLDVLAFDAPRPLTPDVEFHIPPLQESNTTTWEVGYRGLLADRVLLAGDLWYSERRNFVSALQVATPLLFLEGQSLAGHAVPGLTQHFMERGDPQEVAQQKAIGIVGGMAGIPLGVLSSDEVSFVEGRSDFLVTYRNIGRVNLWGADLSAQILLDDRWRVNLSASWANRDHFQIGDEERIALNAPTTKLSAAVQYRDRMRGWDGELRGRYNNEFPVLSAPYVATACIDEDPGLLVEPCVDSFFLVDAGIGYRLPWLPGASAHLSVQNVLDEGYRSFAGVPEIGRMALLRLRYAF